MKYKFLDGIIELTNREVTFTRDEVLAYRRGELSLAEIKYKDSALLKLNDEKIKQVLVTSIACTLFAFKNMVVQAYDPNMDKIDGIGNRILGYMRVLGYWLCIVMCLAEMLKDIMSGGDKSSLFKIVLKYIIAFGALYVVPSIFDMIKESF